MVKEWRVDISRKDAIVKNAVYVKKPHCMTLTSWQHLAYLDLAEISGPKMGLV